ncbi:protein of unknown function [Pseudomonas sp. JV241A]|nr:protein of unknown function [Pseudomonas sp. JV241A]
MGAGLPAIASPQILRLTKDNVPFVVSPLQTPIGWLSAIAGLWNKVFAVPAYRLTQITINGG